MTSRRAIAIVDDDELVRSSMVSLLRSFGLEVTAFSSAGAFLQAGPERWDCLISDVHMPQMSGLDLVQHLKSSHPTLPVVLITAFPDDLVKAEAASGRSCCYLEKPCTADAIQGALEDVLGPI
jgi:two-component system response regulator FixJ